MSKKLADDNLAPLADEFGEIKAQMATLKKREKAIKATFQAAGITELEGDLFRVTLSDIEDKYAPDWQAIVKKMKPSRQMLAANQKISKAAHTRINCNARTGDE